MRARNVSHSNIKTLRWLEECGGSKEIHALPDIGHVIPLENGWQRFTDELAEFIRRNTP